MNSRKTNGISSDAVAKKTGKTWEQWIALLDKQGAARLDHKGIVALLSGKYKVAGWWRQMVAVGYEQARGLRAKHQSADGFSVSASKTMAAPLSRVFRAWRDAALRKQWLDAEIEIRKATPPKSMRLRWSGDGTPVEARFYQKGAARSQVTVEHRRLPDARAAKRMQAYWKARVEALAQLLS